MTTDKYNNIVRNLIVYILIKYRYRNTIQSLKAYPLADAFSHHYPFIAECQHELTKMQRQTKKQRKTEICQKKLQEKLKEV